MTAPSLASSEPPSHPEHGMQQTIPLPDWKPDRRGTIMAGSAEDRLEALQARIAELEARGCKSCARSLVRGRARPRPRPARLPRRDGCATHMARRYGRAPRAERCRLAVPPGHLWPPSGASRISEWTLRVIGCCHVSGLECGGSRAAGPYGMRGAGPHHYSALEALPMRLVLPTPPHRRCAIPVL